MSVHVGCIYWKKMCMRSIHIGNLQSKTRKLVSKTKLFSFQYCEYTVCNKWIFLEKPIELCLLKLKFKNVFIIWMKSFVTTLQYFQLIFTYIMSVIDFAFFTVFRKKNSSPIPLHCLAWSRNSRGIRIGSVS